MSRARKGNGGKGVALGKGRCFIALLSMNSSSRNVPATARTLGLRQGES